MRDPSVMMQAHSAISASELTSNAAQQKSILRKRTTSEGDALKLPRKDDDIADLIGGGWKELGLDFDDEHAVPSVMSCQVAVAKEFDKTVAKEVNTFKNLGTKKVDKSKYGGGPCLFGEGKVPVQTKVPTKDGPLSNMKVNMDDPSSLLKDGSGVASVSSQPLKQLPLPPMLKKKDSNPMGALNNALTRALSQPGSRAASRPGSPSRTLSLPPVSPQQNGTSNLLSLAAQDLQSSLTSESSSNSNQAPVQLFENGSNNQSSAYQGIDSTAMSQIMHNTSIMQSTSVAKQSTWGFSEASSLQTDLSSAAFKAMGNKSKSVSTLNMESSLEINDPKPMEVPKPAASFKPLEPSRQTHNSPIKVPKPVSPTTDDSKGAPFTRKNPPPPVEERGSVLAPKKDATGSQQIGCKKADYSYYLDLINDGSEEAKVEKAQPNLTQVKKTVQKSLQVDDSISKNSVKSAKSMFENNSLSKQQSKTFSKSCGNLSKSNNNGSSVSSQSYKSTTTQFSVNEPKLEGTEAASTSTQLKVQSGHNLASLLAKDEMQSSMLVSATGFDQSEDLVVKESLVQNVKATSAKWNESIKKEEKVITYEQNIGGMQKHALSLPKSSMNLKKNIPAVGKTNISASAPAKTNPTMHNSTHCKGATLSQIGQNGNSAQYAGNPEQLLMRYMETPKTTAHASQVMQLHQNAHKSMNGSPSIAVLEQQKKIELERQKQTEYELNQRKVVVDKDAQRNLIPKQHEDNELLLQLERRRSLEKQLAEQQKKQQEDGQAILIRKQEEERRKAEMERQRMLEIQKQEEQRRIADMEHKRVLEMQRQEEERRKAEMERQRILEIQRQEEERRKVEAERQKILEIQRQEEERRKVEMERQKILEIQRQEEQRKKAEAERQRVLEMQRLEEERKRKEAEMQRLLEIQRQEEEQRKAEAERQRLLQLEWEMEQKKQEEERLKREEQERLEEQMKLAERQRMLEEEQRLAFQTQQAKIQLEARQQQELEIKRYQESQFQLEQQQRLVEIQSVQQSGNQTSFGAEREKRQKMHEEQLRLLRQKQEEEQRQLLLLHQQEEALWESKKSFIQASSSTFENSFSQVSTTSMSSESTSSHNIESEQSGQKEIELEVVKVHEPAHAVMGSTNGADHPRSPSSAVNEVFQATELVQASKIAQGMDSELMEYSAPVIHNGSKPNSETMIIPSLDNSSSPERKIQNKDLMSINVATEKQTNGQANPSNKRDSISLVSKIDIVDDPLSFLLSDSPNSVCSSVSSAAPTPSPVPSMIIPSAPAPPPVQPSYSSIATGDAISELRARFNETPVQSTFSDPVPPSPSAICASHNPPSKIHDPPQNFNRPLPSKSVPQSPTYSSREEVVSPNSQRKRLMAQCMSEAAGIKNASVLPSQVKAAKRKTTKSRVERFIEATCGEPQTVVRKTAGGQEYVEVISPESTELARSLLEPSASR